MRVQRLRILSRDGLEHVEVPNRVERSRLGSYWNAVRLFLSTGDESRLRPFRGVKVAGRRLQTDPGEIEKWARRGELDFEEIYQLTV